MEMFWEYFFEDPYSELDLYEEELMGEADFEELFEMYSEDYIEEDWEDEDEDDELFDFYPDYENVAEEDDRYEFLLSKKIYLGRYRTCQSMVQNRLWLVIWYFFIQVMSGQILMMEEEEWDINRPTIWDQIVPYAFPGTRGY